MYTHTHSNTYRQAVRQPHSHTFKRTHDQVTPTSAYSYVPQPSPRFLKLCLVFRARAGSAQLKTSAGSSSHTHKQIGRHTHSRSHAQTFLRSASSFVSSSGLPEGRYKLLSLGVRAVSYRCAWNNCVNECVINKCGSLLRHALGGCVWREV